MAVARSSSGDVALRYVLSVLWMTSRLAVMGRMVLRGRSDGLQIAVSSVRDRDGASLMSMNECLFIACISQVARREEILCRDRIIHLIYVYSCKFPFTIVVGIMTPPSKYPIKVYGLSLQ